MPNKEIDKALDELVERILERGRLDQREKQGELSVKDGGVTLRKIHFVQELKTFAKTEAVALADKLIGKEVEVRTSYADPMDEELTANEGDEAVRNFQRKQRLALADYQNPPLKVQAEAQPLDEDDMVRVDPETAKVTETALLNEERSLAEA